MKEVRILSQPYLECLGVIRVKPGTTILRMVSEGKVRHFVFQPRFELGTFVEESGEVSDITSADIRAL